MTMFLVVVKTAAGNWFLDGVNAECVENALAYARKDRPDAVETCAFQADKVLDTIAKLQDRTLGTITFVRMRQ